VLRVEGSEQLRNLADAFSEEAILDFFDENAFAVGEAVKAFLQSMGAALKRHWGRTYAEHFFSKFVTGKGEWAAIAGFRHDYASVLAGGRSIPPHMIKPRNPRGVLRIPVATKKHSEDAKRERGGFIYRRWARHPGVKGKDCVSRPFRSAHRVFVSRTRAAIRKLMLSLTRQ